MKVYKCPKCLRNNDISRNTCTQCGKELCNDDGKFQKDVKEFILKR